MGLDPSCFLLWDTQEALDSQRLLIRQSRKGLKEGPPRPSHSTKRKHRRGGCGRPKVCKGARGKRGAGPRSWDCHLSCTGPTSPSHLQTQFIPDGSTTAPHEGCSHQGQ